ncbi:MAG TPA: hypothetical protein VGH28_04010 [Polyangiaceae bacterium]|jgi:tetratricopeptide (TPR) repeat protein
MRLGAVTCAFALALALATSAHADPTPSELQAARELFSKAEKDEAAAHWNEALDKLKRAITVKSTPGLRFHIAFCEEKLGRLVAALADYTAADQAARDQNDKDVIDAVAEPLKTLRIRVPTLTVEVPALEGAHVELDGTPVPAGLYGVAMPVEPGLHRVVATAPGKRQFTTEVTLHEREADSATVQWRDAPKLPDEATLEHHDQPAAHDARETPSHGSKAGAIVTTVLAAAFLGFGIGSYVAADGAEGDFVSKCPTQLTCDDLRGPVRTWDALALTGFIAAGAMAVVSVVLWIVPSSKHGASARVELRPFGAALTGSF